MCDDDERLRILFCRVGHKSDVGEDFDCEHHSQLLYAAILSSTQMPKRAFFCHNKIARDFFVVHVERLTPKNRTHTRERQLGVSTALPPRYSMTLSTLTRYIITYVRFCVEMKNSCPKQRLSKERHRHHHVKEYSESTSREIVDI